MAKLWKCEWKYHIFFVIAIVMGMVWDTYNESGWFVTVVQEEIFNGADALFVRDWMIISIAQCILHTFFEKTIIIVLAGLLVKKAILYYIEKNAYGREFFQSLPVRRLERFRFHLLMDTMTIVVTMVIAGIYECLWVQKYLTQMEVQLKWLSASYLGMTMTNICYLLLFLGVLYFAESIFVNGPMKLVGGCGIVWFVGYFITCLYERWNQNPVIQAIYGFLIRVAVPGNHCLEIVDYEGSRMTTYYRWVHDNINPEIWYKGEKQILSLQSSSFTDMQYALEEYTSVNSLYDFSNFLSYIGYAVGYLMIALILILLAGKLISRQEISKEDVYFAFAKYLISGVIAASFYMALMLHSYNGWHQVMCAVAALLVFALLLGSFNLEIIRQILRKWKGKEGKLSHNN